MFHTLICTGISPVDLVNASYLLFQGAVFFIQGQLVAYISESVIEMPQAGLNALCPQQCTLEVLGIRLAFIGAELPISSLLRRLCGPHLRDVRLLRDIIYLAIK